MVEGPNGLVHGMSEGKVWIEMSTTDSKEMLRLGTIMEKIGVHCCEAPVSGGCHRAATGNIAILVGGSRTAFDLAFPALKAMGYQILHVGELGKASVLKVVTNYLASTHLAALGEGLMVCKKAGIDLQKAYEGK